MQAILGVYNYKVVTVDKHTDLFRNLSRQRPAVIIINQSFTRNCNVDIVSKLKTDPSTSGIPIIYIGSEPHLREPLHTNGGSLIEFVEEPVRIKNLRHYIDRWTTFRSIHVRH
jgi:response regulator RpfG family c-di-GMP phosphodiesterase